MDGECMDQSCAWKQPCEYVVATTMTYHHDLVTLTAMNTIRTIVIIVTRPKPPCGRQGLVKPSEASSCCRTWEWFAAVNSKKISGTLAPRLRPTNKQKLCVSKASASPVTRRCQPLPPCQQQIGPASLQGECWRRTRSSSSGRAGGSQQFSSPWKRGQAWQLHNLKEITVSKLVMEVLSSGVVALSLSLVRNACTISRSHPSRARPRAASLSLQASSTFLWERSHWTDITTTPEHHWICFTDLKGFVFPNLSYFRFWLHYNHEKPWNYLEKPWKPTKNHEKLWNYLEKP